MEQKELTPKHKELLKRLQQLFPEATLEEDDNIVLCNRGGYPYAKGPGIIYRRITSSYAGGPEWDFSKEIRNYLCNMGFTQSHYYTTGCDERNYENYEIYYFTENENLEYEQ